MVLHITNADATFNAFKTASQTAKQTQSSHSAKTIQIPHPQRPRPANFIHAI